ncbi:Rieske 2Fe-2S domain-containing protein [Streptomyces iconiensis]|uniref:Rieske-type oxygenase n=1 Tax=Streptomyces iconiensis TaxID=1384038 RepID=A0ABT7A2I8_9ACTN|nr:Rieske 2Fe-2S domain-containing protein [Streptomyces iconiensis]MDJ1135511.1 Rieske 2Fe-2S domain-containing protein [Streptomyces iconiensis]
MSARSTTEDHGPRRIEAGAPPERYARGWHCLGLASGFKDGKPHGIEAFGTELVAFQAAGTGELHVLNAYCPHMGGNLAHGTVKGDALACPFHDWRWAGNGKCAGIPYAHRVPPRARTRAWTTLEENGQLFVWYDPQGTPPPEGVTIPRIEGAFSDEWSDWTWNSIRIDGSHCREIVDNVVDMAHFFYVHNSFPTYFKNVFEGHVASQYMESDPREDMTAADTLSAQGRLRSEASYHGPSYMIDHLWTEVGGATAETVLINCHYPVSPDAFVLQYGALVKKLPGMTDEAAAQAAAQAAEGLATGFEEDVEIWLSKTRIDNPLLCDQDGPVYQLRRWYEQFYVDVEDVRPEMTDRFEFEIDTERAVRVWRDEVDANLARRAQSAQR